MLNKKIAARESTIEGSGLFAVDDIDEGEFIWQREYDEPVWHIDVVRSWSPEKQEAFFRYGYQVDESHFAGPEDGISNDPADLMNHSCDPNVWFLNDDTMIARRAIKTGEEITYDYATSEVSELFSLDCLCGKSNCRGKIAGTDFLKIASLQELYGSHVMSHVTQALEDTK